MELVYAMVRYEKTLLIRQNWLKSIDILYKNSYLIPVKETMKSYSREE